MSLHADWMDLWTNGLDDGKRAALNEHKELVFWQEVERA